MSNIVPFKGLHLYIEELTMLASENEGYLVMRYFEEGYWFVGIKGLTEEPIEATGKNLVEVILAIYRMVNDGRSISEFL